MTDDIFVFCQSSIKISKDKVIYFDPYRVDQFYHDADYIFITHNHYDHFSLEDIKKVVKEDTKMIVPKSMEKEMSSLGLSIKDILFVEPFTSYDIDDFSFETFPSYNLEAPFHKKEDGWVGYLLYYDHLSYYVPGDTDIISEIKSISCDVLFVPIGGTYTMSIKYGVELTKLIHPKLAIPIHYGSIVGSVELGEQFRRELEGIVDTKIFIK